MAIDVFAVSRFSPGSAYVALPLWDQKNEAEDFAVAVRQKLLLEVSGRTLAWVSRPVAATPPVDCLFGEKLNPSFLEPLSPELNR